MLVWPFFVMPTLYPLKFRHECKQTVWGGTRLHELGKDIPDGFICGETWELGAFESLDSIISNGFLEGNTLSEAIEVYMAELVGETVYENFGQEFPLLIKFIDTNDLLSVQVHPDDDFAIEMHGKYGKTEAWYVLDAEPQAQISLGFNKNVSREEVLLRIENNTLHEILQTRTVSKGDFFFIPAGTVHAIGKGVTLCEIQQASDITYRLFDYNRPGLDGNPRELHVNEALDVLNFSRAKGFNLPYEGNNGSIKLLKNAKFNINLISINNTFDRDYIDIDSFVILICVEGNLIVKYEGGNVVLIVGEVVLLPAELKEVALIAKVPSKLVEVYLD
jgi:mannose-6-phosphate isomerase